ncbi:MAG: hypothetical protein ACJAXE_001481 [Neolewinella sp.]|jgi:hypothetical protein
MCFPERIASTFAHTGYSSKLGLQNAGVKAYWKQEQD